MEKTKIEELSEKLKGFGLLDKQALDTARNVPLATQFINFIEPTNTPIDKSKASLLLRWSTAVVTKLKDKSAERSQIGADHILNGNLSSPAQVDAAIEFLSAGMETWMKRSSNGNAAIHHTPKRMNLCRTLNALNPGISMSKEEVKTIVLNYVRSSEKAQESKWAWLGKTTGEIKKLEALKWCNPIDLKSSVDESFLELFGPKDAQPVATPSSKPTTGTNSTKAKKNPSSDSKSAALSSSKESSSASEPSIFEVGMLSQLYAPGGNPQTDPKLTQEHLKATGGKVVTRFPPEPNGFLHIGRKNFPINSHNTAFENLAKPTDFNALLLSDVTIPSHFFLNQILTDSKAIAINFAEEQIYIDSIVDIIRWLGFEPAEITYSSDYFGKLYELAEQLILIDKAYVCFCTGAEIKANRGGEERGPRKACVHRTLPVETSLAEFRKMRDGHYQPNQIILRMKQDLEDGNPQMWDLVAYRILNASHHRTQDQWKIYPTYDFTHCLVDSFENISHSLCTTEFIQSRVSYEWLCHALNVYTPRQTEYGRLNLEGTVMSKRKIMKLVNEGHVEGWDDPRLYTLIALRRRVSNIAIHRFEQTVRQHLELTTPRLMMVLKPIKVTIENLPGDHLEFIDRPVHPKVPEMGSVRVPFTNVIYIEREDFSLVDSEDFFRLTPTRPVGLFQPVTKANKPKAYIHWIAHSESLHSPVKVHETRIYKTLFKSTNPASLDDFLTDVDSNSLEIVHESSSKTLDLSTVGLENVRFQGMRTAYFTLDKASILKPSSTSPDSINQASDSQGQPRLFDHDSQQINWFLTGSSH
ncbi:hypothetical protein H4Q26_004091 [Puccinia striiformis f. sp. tritici PST-130]|nr:hypothetical protein H4Q26_004091 [Puccinia striiformis f. sp. tritici PST-130]